MMIMDENPLTFKLFNGVDVSEDMIQKCSDLFSNNYGIWGCNGPWPGKQVKLSLHRLKIQYLDISGSFVVVALNADRVLFGHALGVKFASREALDNETTIIWITQLVVAREFRRKRIASSLCRCIWDTFSPFAIGIASSNPYAVKSLESGSSNSNVPLTKQLASKILQESGVEYLFSAIVNVEGDNCKVQSNYFIQHDFVNEAVETLIQAGKWKLGRIDDGEEFVAMCFRDDVVNARQCKKETVFVKES